MMEQLLPPSSKMHFPNLSATYLAINLPTQVEPVKLIKGTFLSLTIA